MKKFLVLLTTLLLMISYEGLAQCPNLNSSFANFTYWQAYIGSCASGNYSIGPSAAIPGRHTIMNATDLIATGTIQDEHCPVIRKVPQGFNYSILLGNSSTGGEVDAISYDMVIDSSNSLLILSFAWVMEDPSHNTDEQPLFKMQIKDTLGNVIKMPCSDVSFISGPMAAGLVCSGTPKGKDWTTVGFSLLSLIGQKIKIYFEVRDCTLSGHYGYAYLSAQCRPMSIDLTYCEGSSAARLKAPDGFVSYTWTRTSQPSWHAYTQQINIQNPLDGEIFTCKLESALGPDCSSELQTVIAKTSIDASFAFGVANSQGYVNLDDPRHQNSQGIYQSYYDTCTRTVTFVDLSTVINSKKEDIIWEIHGVNDNSHDSLWTYTFPETPGNEPVDYLVRLTVFAENGCGDTSKALDENWIRIYPTPQVTIIGNVEMCEGNENLLEVREVRSYFVKHEWGGKMLNGRILQPSFGDTLTVYGPGTYFVKSLDSVGCYAYDTIIVEPLSPKMDVSVTPVKCFGDSTGGFSHGRIEGIGPMTTLPFWLQEVNGVIDTLDNNAKVNGGRYSDLKAGTYTFYAKDANDCELVKKVIVPEPTLLTLQTSSDSTFCLKPNGKVHVLAEGATPPYKYSWRNASENEVGTSADVSNVDAGTYHVYVADSNDCKDTGYIEVWANPYPVMSVDTIVEEKCEHKNGIITVSVSYAREPIRYTWTSNVSVAPMAIGLKTGSYNVKATDGNGCEVDTTVFVPSYPAVKITGETTPESCHRKDGTITTIVTSGAPHTLKYAWNGGITDTTNNLENLPAGKYTLTATDSLCSAGLEFVVEHVDGPKADFDVVSYTVPTGSVFAITDASKGLLSSWAWNMGDGTTATGSSVYHVFEEAGDYVVFLEVTDTNGCIDTISKVFHVYDEMSVFIPNSFTPNGDGINDTWSPVMKEYSSEGYLMNIFDRWGQKIFTTTDPEEKWDGTVDGKFVESNTIYTYQIKVKDITGQEFEYNGHITVIR